MMGLRPTGGRRPLRTVAVVMLAVLLLATPGAAASLAERVAERGPATLLVGTTFTLLSPPSWLLGALRGAPRRLHACRFGHGVKMMAAGAVLLPAGLLLAPFHPSRLPDAWMDGLVDAQQEDYCSRPVTALLP